MRNNEQSSRRVLFGEGLGWDLKDWTSSDDTVRGGASKSQLTIEDGHVIFYGCLDIEKLGGAGFASQRTTGSDRCWDLSRFEGIELTCNLDKSDDKTYTFILKDQLLPLSANGREQSTISWEYDFSRKDAQAYCPKQGLWTFSIPWDQLKPTYRGRPKNDAEPLRRNDIKRISIMIRSFFGTQQGDFYLDIATISAVAGLESMQPTLRSSMTTEQTSSTHSLDKAAAASASEVHPLSKFWDRLFCWKL